MVIIRAITHIQIIHANARKIAVLDELGTEYMRVCQEYINYFCTELMPNEFLDPCITTVLSERWQRVAIMQAAALAKSWHTNRAKAYSAYESKCHYYEQQKLAHPNLNKKAPQWHEFNIPVMKKKTIQANANVVALELPNLQERTPIGRISNQAQRTQQEEIRTGKFDYWLQIATLIPRQPLYVPLRLSKYHRETIGNHVLNSSVTLNYRRGGWWLTVTLDDSIEEQIPTETVSVDTGISNFLTSSTGKHYGSFDQQLVQRYEREHLKRQRKAKLRACLEKKDVPKAKLPSVADARLGRHVRRLINEVVNEFYEDHPHAQVVIEDLSVSNMRFKAKRMNARLYASNLAHIPRQLQWGAAKRGLSIVEVHSAYSSQECNQCHFTDRYNRPSQQTFCCRCCGFQAHADVNAAFNLLARHSDEELNTCQTTEQVKALLDARHQICCKQGCRSLPSRLVGASDTSPPSTGAGHYPSI